jgi:hypothetical protein
MKQLAISIIFLFLISLQANSTNQVMQPVSVADIPARDTTGTSFVISNEQGATGLEGGLIDYLVEQGYGDSSLYAVMQYLQPLSGGAIPQWFMDSLAKCPAGSEIFNAPCSIFTSVTNNPVGINSDGTSIVVDVTGRDYYGKEGYETFQNKSDSTCRMLFTSASSSSYYINTGCSFDNGDTYKVFAIVWANSTMANSITPKNTTDKKFSICYSQASNRVIISLENAKDRFNISVFDAFGRLVMRKNITSNEPLDISSLTKGVYFIGIGTGRQHRIDTQKLVIYR